MRQAIRRRRAFKNIGVVLLILAAIVGIALLLLFATVKDFSFHNLFAGGDGDEMDVISPNRYSAELDPNAQEGMLNEELATGVKKEYGTIAFRVNTTPFFESGDTLGNILFESSSDNVHLLRLEIELEDGSVIYQSGFLYPDMYIPSAKLDTALENGEYYAIAHVKAYDQQSEEYVGEALQDLYITVGSTTED